MTLDRKTLATLAALAAALGVVVFPVRALLSADTLLTGRDLHRLFRPAAHALQARLTRFELPEWDPFIACGQPFVGEGQTQAFYPPKLLQLVMGPDRGLNLLAVLHPLFAAVCAFFVVRRLGRSAPAAFVGAVATGGTPLFLAAYVSANLEYGACWLPLTLLFALRLGERMRLRDAALGGLCIAMPALAGALELALGSGLLFALVALGTTSERRRVSTGVALAAVVSVLVSMPEVLPVAAQSKRSERSAALSLVEASRWSMGGADLVRMAVPRLPTETEGLEAYKDAQSLFDAVYLGASALLLAAFGLLRGRRFWALPALVAFLLMLGARGGLFAALHLLPGLDRLRFPAKFALLFAPLVALGAAEGVEALGERRTRLGLLALPLAPLVIHASDFATHFTATVSVLLVGAALWMPGPALLRRAVACLAVAVDLLGYSAVVQVVPTTSAKEEQHLVAAIPPLDPRFRLVERIRQREWFQLDETPDTSPPELDAFTPNFPVVSGVRLANGYGPNLNDRVMQLAWTAGESMRDLMAAKRSLVMAAKAEPGETVLPLGQAALIDRPRALPRGLFLTRFEVLTAEAVQARTLAADFEPSVALLEESPGVASGAGPAVPIALDERRPEEISLRTEGTTAGLALLQDTWDAGWTATVDGAEAKVLRADGIFLSVAVPAGTHEVVFRYRSRPLRTGLSLAALGLVIVALSFALNGRREAARAL